MSHGSPVVAIVGPTASGKTALSIEVAARLGGEIISMDSRQVYRGMDIGTAKPTPDQQSAVPHHGLDLVSPDERFSAGRFARYARQKISEIRERGAVPILVGGTGFFLRALTHPIFAEPDLDAERRTELQAYLSRFETSTLLGWLRAFDPATATRLSASGGRQRVLRALELPLLTGRSLSWWHENAPPEADPVEVLVFALDVSRDRLNNAIADRVAKMVDAGLVDEVTRLVRAGYSRASPGMNATGYVEILPFLEGGQTIEAALEEIRRNTRAYSRRQLTWLRHQLPPNAIWLDTTRPANKLVDEIASIVSAAAPPEPGDRGSP